MFGRLLRSEAEARVLGTVLFADGLHLREVARRADVAPSEAKHELDSLVSLGVLRPDRKGNMLIFNADPQCPFLGELRGLYLKTDGVFGLLRTELSRVRSVQYAFIYGSFARGDYTEKSDVDVIVIGAVDEDELAAAFSKLESTTGREINYILWSEKDLTQKLREMSGFISKVLSGKIIWLVGEKDEFERTAKKAPNRGGASRRTPGSRTYRKR